MYVNSYLPSYIHLLLIDGKSYIPSYIDLLLMYGKRYNT